MASFLCPRVMSSPSPVTRTFSSPSRTLLRCLHTTASPARHHRSLPQRPKTTTTHQTPNRGYKTVQEARSRTYSGPFSARAAILFLTAGACMIVYFRFEKERIQRQKIADAAKGVGKPKVGGKFELVDQKGRRWTEGNLKGGYTLVYFGFSHCPDICPDELDKMARMIDLINGPPNSTTAPIPPPSPPPSALSPSKIDPTASPTAPSSPSTPTAITETSSPTDPPTARPPLLPIFITCDPARDTPAVLSSYLSEFHPSLVGLTGTWQQVKDVCRAYRVYFSTPEGAKPGMDYLVDHSIYFYLMDPDGDFVECLGRQHTPESAAKVIKEHMSDWRQGIKAD